MPAYPCHTQAVKRAIQLVTEASSLVIGHEAREGFISQRILARKGLKGHASKKDFLQGWRGTLMNKLFSCLCCILISFLFCPQWLKMRFPSVVASVPHLSQSKRTSQFLTVWLTNSFDFSLVVKYEISKCGWFSPTLQSVKVNFSVPHCLTH